jgi:hypothetical protein
MEKTIQEMVAAAFSELGMPLPTAIIQTVLMKDRYFVGWKFRYDGGYAVWRAGADMVELYDHQHNLLKSIAVETERKAA